jgi:hypothetical protein
MRGCEEEASMLCICALSVNALFYVYWLSVKMSLYIFIICQDQCACLWGGGFNAVYMCIICQDEFIYIHYLSRSVCVSVRRRLQCCVYMHYLSCQACANSLDEHNGMCVRVWEHNVCVRGCESTMYMCVWLRPCVWVRLLWPSYTVCMSDITVVNQR